MISRRAFTAGTLLSASAAFAKFSKPLSLQLYTVREQLPKDPKGTLEAIKKAGFEMVEPGRAQFEYANMYKDLGLKTPSCHVEAPLVTGNYEAWKPLLGNSLPKGYSWAKAIDDSKANGVKYMIVSYLVKSERTVAGFAEKFADQMNKAGEQALKSGLQLCYHHHSFEFEPVGGKRMFDTLIQRFDPKLVKFQCDVFWLKMGGEDPAAMLRKLKGRVAAVHLKDVAAGSKVEFDEGKVPFEAFKEVGSGSLNIPDLLKACEDAGVQVYVIEQDRCAGSPLDSIAKSVKYLRGLA